MCSCFMLSDTLFACADEKCEYGVQVVFVTVLLVCWLNSYCFPFVYTMKIMLCVCPGFLILQEIVGSSDHCQEQLMYEKKASWALPVYWDLRTYCSICHRPTANSSHLNCYSGSSTIWIEARMWNQNASMTQIEALLLSADKGQWLIFIPLALSTAFDGLARNWCCLVRKERQGPK